MIFPFGSVYIIKGNLCFPPRHLHNHLVPCFGCGKPGRHYRHFQQSFHGLYSGRHGHDRCCFFDQKKLTWNLQPWRFFLGCRTDMFLDFFGGGEKRHRVNDVFLENVNETNTKGDTGNCSTVLIWTMELYRSARSEKKKQLLLLLLLQDPENNVVADALSMESGMFSADLHKSCFLRTCSSTHFIELARKHSENS